MNSGRAREAGYWEGWNAEFCEHRSALDMGSARRQEYVLGALRKLKIQNARILEVGCGTGWLVERLLEFGNVDATDLAADVVARAQKRIPQARFFGGDFLSLPFPEEHYDAVVTLEAFAHVPDRSAFINRIFGVLRPGGYLILTTQNRFVFDRMETMAGQEHPFSNWLTLREARDYVRRRFSILAASTIFPAGHIGVMRIVNSTKLERIIARLGIDVTRLKERLGFGQTITIVAKRPI